MKNYCTIYLTRHGETEWNEKRIVQGHSDIPLNAKGEEQAKQLGDQFKNINFEAVFSSNLIRAKKSAEIMVQGKKLTVTTTEALMERDFGRFEGKGLDELRRSLGETMVLSIKKQQELKLFDVENDEQVITRLIPFMKKMAIDYLGKNIMLVTHGGLLRAFLDHVGYKIPDYSKKPMKNSGYLIIESDGVRFKVKEEKLF